MTGASGFVELQRKNRRATFVILGGTFALLFVVVNLVFAAFGAYSSQECSLPTVTTRPGVPVTEQCVTTFEARPTVAVTVAAAVGVYLLIAWFGSARAALTMVHAQRADGPEFAELRDLVEQMAIASGTPMPQVYVIDDPAPNAFATGRNPKHAAITVTTGLLAVMSRRELRGVIAHEMAHIRNRDIAVTTLAVLAVGAIAIIADIALRMGVFGGMARRRSNDNGAAVLLLVGLAIYLIAVPAGMLLKAALSRRRESLADVSAVQMTREPAGLRSALEKLEADTTVVSSPSAATAHLWIESPLDREVGHGIRGSFGRLMDTHPPLSERIAILRSIEGLDPEGRGPNDPPSAAR